MKLIRSSMTVLAIALSLAACGDKGESSDKQAKAVLSKVTQAKVTANTNSEAKLAEATKPTADNGFKQVLDYVPADTAYLFTNQKAFPRDSLEFHLKRSQQIFAMWENMLEDSDSDSKTGEAPKATADKTIKANKKDPSKEKDKLLDKFLKALFADFRSNMTVDKLSNTGIKADGHSALYAVDLAPVLRYQISSKAAVIDTVKRAEKESGYKVNWKKCGDYQCIESQSDKDNMTLAIVLQDDQLAASFFPMDKKDVVMAHLSGKSKPEKSYRVKDWDNFLSKNKYLGYGDGFVNLQQVYKMIEPTIIKAEKKQAESRGEPYDEKASQACHALVERHLENIPKAVFGITEIEKQALAYEILLKSTPKISSVLKGIPNALPGMKNAESPVFDLGLNINFGKLREGLTQYTNFLVKNAEELKCDAVKPAAIRKSMSSFAMATMMGADQFKAVYLSLNDFKLGKDGKPEKVDALFSVVADNPGALLQMLAMVNPAFATLKLPKDGSAIKLPEGLIPPNPTGYTPDLYLSQSDKMLNLMVGAKNPTVKDFKTRNPALLWSTVDSKRYYNLLGDVMQQSPDQKDDTEAKKAMDMMTKMGDYSGVVYTEIGADDRGILINYTIKYDE